MSRRTRPVEARRYRTTAELIAAVRHEHLITQVELATRAGLGVAQLSRYERGRAEPGQDVLRRLLAAVGQAPTYGVEPTEAAVDERFEGDGFWFRVGWDSFLVVQRLVWPVVDAAVPVVLGGELGAVAHGVPVPDPDLLLHLREADLPALARVVRAARITLATAEGMPLEGVDDVDRGDELAILTGFDAVRVLVSDTLPASTLVTVPRSTDESGETIRVPAATVEELLASGALGPTALALTRRFVQRADAAT